MIVLIGNGKFLQYLLWPSTQAGNIADFLLIDFTLHVVGVQVDKVDRKYVGARAIHESDDYFIELRPIVLHLANKLV